MTGQTGGRSNPPATEPERYLPTALGDTLKKAAAAMRDAEVPFMLCGSVACWVRGGPELVTKDVDFCVKPGDAERALEALAGAGMKTERPPEGWLFKAWDGDVLVDLLFAPADVPVGETVLERADELSVLALPMRVAAVDDVIATKLLALDEHSVDYAQLLQIGRGLREQIHWGPLRQRTEDSPFALAFFTLVEKLGVVSAEELAGAGEVDPASLPAPQPDVPGGPAI